MQNKTLYTIEIERCTMGRSRGKSLQYYIDEKTGCYECVSHAGNEKGYIQITVNGKHRTAHKYLYERFIAKVPENLKVMHICDNPRCLNVNHYTIGTTGDNNDDAYKKGRRDQKNRKFLTDDEKLALCEDKKAKMTRVKLAKKYGIGISTVGDIWKAYKEGKLQSVSV